jgi:F-type H+-transporting ATPase subunit gamma
MPSLKSLKNRIKSIKSTQKITKAMKMVAASKLKRAREQAEASQPYANKMASIVHNLSGGSGEQQLDQVSLLSGTGKDDVHLIIVATSDRGLCGSFNTSIIKSSRRKVSSLLAQGKKVKIICVGKKGYDLLKSQYQSHIIKHYDGLGKKGIKFVEANSIAEVILEQFEKREFDYCHIIYNKFKSVISQILTDQQLIPLHFEGGTAQESSNCDYEPSEEAILENLLPKNVAVQIYHALLENFASEQGARMSAMENATRNSGEIIKELNLLYNRTRQAYITKELIEIISGAEAV